MSDAEFLSAFEAAAIPRPEWTHEAHVRMAWLYLVRFPRDEALEKIRGGIRRLNAVIGSPDGYHETITVAFVRVIADRLLAGEDFDAFRARNPEVCDRKLPVLLHHYTRELLYSPEARREFVPPDRLPLPSGKNTLIGFGLRN